MSDFSKNFIKKLLTVNPQKRIKLEEIKEHEYYKLGEKLMRKEKAAYNKEGLRRKIFEKMKKLVNLKKSIKKMIQMYALTPFLRMKKMNVVFLNFCPKNFKL